MISTQNNITIENPSFIAQLYDDVLLQIISFLDIPSILSLVKVDRKFSTLSKNNDYWKRKLAEHWPDEFKLIKAMNFPGNYFTHFFNTYKFKLGGHPILIKLAIFTKEKQLNALKKLAQKEKFLTDHIHTIFKVSKDFNWNSDHQDVFNYLFNSCVIGVPFNKEMIEIAVWCHQWEWLQKQLCSTTTWVFPGAYDFTHLISKEEKMSALLFFAVQDQLLDLLQFLLKEGCDINIKEVYEVDKDTVLHRAVKNNDLKMVEFLLLHGADVNNINRLTYTPLHQALHENSQPGIVEVLIKNGADLEAKTDFHDTPLHTAIWYSNQNLLEILFAHSANLEARNLHDLTPLQVAIQRNNLKKVQQLISKGVDVSIIALSDFNYPPPGGIRPRIDPLIVQCVWIAKIKRYVNALEKKRSFLKIDHLYDKEINTEKQATMHLLWLVSEGKEGQAMASEKTYLDIVNRTNLKTLNWPYPINYFKKNTLCSFKNIEHSNRSID